MLSPPAPYDLFSSCAPYDAFSPPAPYDLFSSCAPYDVFSPCPPNSDRMAESSLLAKVASPC